MGTDGTGNTDGLFHTATQDITALTGRVRANEGILNGPGGNDGLTKNVTDLTNRLNSNEFVAKGKLDEEVNPLLETDASKISQLLAGKFAKK